MGGLRKPIVVQISGMQGSGKSTLASSLSCALDKAKIRSVQHSYARVLYEMHNKVLDVMGKYVEVPPKDGRLLQLLGTEWGRETYGKNIWVDIVRKDVIEMGSWAKVHIISDCRFPNEAKAFFGEEYISLLYRLHCPVEVRKARIEATPGQSWRETPHASETALEGYAGFNRWFNTDSMPVEEIAKIIMCDIEDALLEDS